MPFGFTHEPIRVITTSAITSFFKDIEVYGAENVPEDGPIIL
jgi:glycerol-3-phosphate O-acyltransferase/dihydroxyacetone phosphate acyltransferase